MGQILTRHAKRILISIVGMLLLILGAVLIFAPGPGLLLFAAGIAVLATEFEWARRIQEWLKQKIQTGTAKLGKRGEKL